MSNIKNSDFQHIVPFERKKKKAFTGKCKSTQCLRYYYKKTNDIDYSITKTLHYIDEFYIKQKYNKGVSCKNKSKSLSKLINRYDSLYYQSKISFSIISSVVISIIITFIFSLLQHKDNNGNTYFSLFIEICSMRENLELVTIMQTVFIIIAQYLLLILYISILVLVAWYTIILVKLIYLINTNKRLILIPYERDVIIKTIETYNIKISETLKKQ